MAHARSRGRTRTANRRNRRVQHDGWLIFAHPEQHWTFRLLGLVVRARAELTLITVTVTIYVLGRDHFGPEYTLYGMTATLLVVGVVPVSRRYVIRRFWCVMTRHRLRACMVQTFTMARQNGRMPFLLWSRPSSTGEHVTVWLPAGLAVKDLDRQADRLAAACWAKEVHVVMSEWRATVAHVYVARRELLSTTDLAPDVNDTDTTENDSRSGRHLHPVRDIPRDLKHDLVRDPAEEQAALAALTPALRRTTNSTTDGPDAGQNTGTTDTTPTSPGTRTTGSRSQEQPTTGYGGQDVSDYI